MKVVVLLKLNLHFFLSNIQKINFSALSQMLNYTLLYIKLLN
jgi:hypothetical protein